MISKLTFPLNHSFYPCKCSVQTHHSHFSFPLFSRMRHAISPCQDADTGDTAELQKPVKTRSPATDGDGKMGRSKLVNITPVYGRFKPIVGYRWHILDYLIGGLELHLPSYWESSSKLAFIFFRGAETTTSYGFCW